MDAKISVFVICVEAIIYLLLYKLHECTFKLHSVPSVPVLCHSESILIYFVYQSGNKFSLGVY